MKKYGLKLNQWSKFRLNRTAVDAPILALLLLCFLLGSVFGCFIGSGVDSGAGDIAQMLLEGHSTGIGGFLHCLGTVGQYHVIVLLAATSVLGVFVIPAVSFFRGYFLSCTAAATITALPEQGVAAALICCGISAVLTVPGLFILELDGFGLSKRLRALSAGKSDHFSDRNVLYHLGFVAVCLLIAAAVDQLLVPLLLAYIL